jgi:hypothetical protein
MVVGGNYLAQLQQDSKCSCIRRLLRCYVLIVVRCQIHPGHLLWQRTMGHRRETEPTCLAHWLRKAFTDGERLSEGRGYRHRSRYTDRPQV